MPNPSRPVHGLISCVRPHRSLAYRPFGLGGWGGLGTVGIALIEHLLNDRKWTRIPSKAGVPIIMLVGLGALCQASDHPFRNSATWQILLALASWCAGSVIKQPAAVPGTPYLVFGVALPAFRAAVLEDSS